MLTYIAAVATAATISITPIQNPKDFEKQNLKGAQWATDSNVQIPIIVSSPISLSGATPTYLLSSKEQRVFRNALLKSVRIRHTGARLS